MKRIMLFLFLAVIVSFLLTASVSYNRHDAKGGAAFIRDTTFINPGNYLFSQPASKWVNETLASMTLEEKAGQLVFPNANGLDASDTSASYIRLKRLVEEYKVGGFVFFRSKLPEKTLLVNKLQRLSKLPLLMAADFEHGVGMRIAEGTDFPSLMALGAADDSLLAYEMGAIIGRESRRIGIHQNYAPVVDVNNNPDNPIINTRSPGEDPVMVSRIAAALMKGMQDAKLVATIKHFPGHGNTSQDSHNETAIISSSKSEFNSTELYPFRRLIDDGALSVMVGHIRIPEVYASGLPATLSPEITTDLLKKDLHFKGLVVTDAMNMHAISKVYPDSLSSLMAINAGNDLILFPANPESVITAIANSVRAGLISEERIDASVRKLLTIKEWAGLSENRLIDNEDILHSVKSGYAEKIAFQIAKKSITLARDKKNIIPLKTAKKKEYIHLIVTENPGDNGAYFDSLLTSAYPGTETVRLNKRTTNRELKKMIAELKKHKTIIISVYNSISSFKGTRSFDPRIEKMSRKINALNKNKILLSHADPYITDLFPSAGTYMLNYGSSAVSELALFKALTGENQITGKLPVTIPSAKLRKGDGLTRKSVRIEYIASEDTMFHGADRLIQQGIQDSVAPGMTALVIKDGDIVYKRTAGTFTYDPSSTPVTDSSIYDLASVSKVIGTTTAVMICIDRKLFSLDDKVVKYLPQFGAKGKKNITIRNLLVHNSGLPAFKKYYQLVKNGNELLKDIYNSELIYKTGEKMVYSDLGMITMQKIIEKVTGKRLDKFLHAEVFSKLGMKSTMYAPPASLKHRMVPTELDNYWRNRLLIGEVHDEAASMLGGIAGHAGLFSTAGDLAVFLQMLQQGGEYDGRRYIKNETVALFIKRQSDQSTRALGWDTPDEKYPSAGKFFSKSSYGHTGYTGTSVWTDPEKNVIVILLTNRVHPTRVNSKLMRFRPEFHDEIMRALGY